MPTVIPTAPYFLTPGDTISFGGKQHTIEKVRVLPQMTDVIEITTVDGDVLQAGRKTQVDRVIPAPVAQTAELIEEIPPVETAADTPPHEISAS